MFDTLGGAGAGAGEALTELLARQFQEQLLTRQQEEAERRNREAQGLAREELNQRREREANDESYRQGIIARTDARDLSETLSPGPITPEQADVLGKAPSTKARVTTRTTLDATPIGAGEMEAGGQNYSVMEPTPEQAERAFAKSERRRIISGLSPRLQQAQGAADVGVPGAVINEMLSDPDKDFNEWQRRADYQEGQIRTRPHRDPVPIVIGTAQGPQILDRGTGTTRPITDGSGATVQPPPTADMRNKAEAKKLLGHSISAIEQLSQKVITKRGVAQRATAAGRSVEAALGNDPEFRTYQDARKAAAGNLAIATQGSRPSDADILAIWLPMIPDVFGDTDQSAKMKWDLIRTLTSAPGGDTAPGAAGGETPYQQYLNRKKKGGG